MRAISRIKPVAAQTINGSTGSYTSAVFDVTGWSKMSAHFLVSGTLPNVKVEIEVCDSTVADKDLIDTAAGLHTGWRVPKTGQPLVANLTASRCDGFTLPAVKWVRVAITGNSNNDTDTVVTMTILAQE